MARTKQVPIANLKERKLKDFFKEAAKSTPESESSAESGSKSSKTTGTARSAKSSTISLVSSSQRSSSQTGSTRKSSSRRKAVKKRLAPGVAVLREIRRLQASTNLLIPLASFIRVLRDVLRAEEERRRMTEAHLPDGFLLEGMRFSADAIACLQEAAEVQLTNFFTLSYYCTLHARRKTLMVRDCQLTRMLLGRNHPLNP